MKSTCISQGYFCCNPLYARRLTPMINFTSKNIEVIDAGTHMKQVSAALNEALLGEDVKIEKHSIDVNPNDTTLRQMSSLYDALDKISKSKVKPDYIMMPLAMPLDILNLNDQYERVTGEKLVFTPENVHYNREKVLNFLKEIGEHPSKYGEYIKYMDPNNQGIEHTYKVIQKINELIDSGIKVYLPAGQPNDLSMKWTLEKDNLKPEFYYYLSKNHDIDGKINYRKNDIEDKNWYKLNLLCFSNAENIGTLNSRGDKFIYSAYDSNVTKYSRGTFNLYPIRKSYGPITGYSFYNKTDSALSDISLRNEDLKKFVGRKYYYFLASDDEHEKFNRYGIKDPNKIYKVSKLDALKNFPKKELLGEYVNSDFSLFFEISESGDVLFNKTNIEGSDRPSIFGMWGSCFAAANALADDIKNNGKTKPTPAEEILNTYNCLDAGYANQFVYESTGDRYYYQNDFYHAEGYYSLANQGLVEYIRHPNLNGARLFEKIGNACRKQGKFENAMKSYQCALGILCNSISYEIHPKMLELTDKIAYCAEKSYNKNEQEKYCNFSNELRKHSDTAKEYILKEKHMIRSYVGV